ncbi:MAG: hypothetical protein EBR82_36970 [Caulobacteraceae bacterium]|nr:hypothetical protein [Caulobacteraceae bacterium]
MTFDDILKLIPTIEAGLAKGKTRYQIAADAHAEIEARPSALTLKPMKERAPRQNRIREPKTEFGNQQTETGQPNGHDAEATPS